MIEIQFNSGQEKKFTSQNQEMNIFIQQASSRTSQLLSLLKTFQQQQSTALEYSDKFEITAYIFTNFYEQSIQSIKEAQKLDQNPENKYEIILSQLLKNDSNNEDNNKNIFSKIFENKSYRVRECLLFNILKMQAQSQDPKILKFIQTLIKQIWIKEKDQNVRMLLSNLEMIEIQKKIFNFELKSFQDQLLLDMKEKMREIEKLEQDARLEGESHKGEEFEALLKEKYEEFEQIFENVSEMQDKIGLNLLFLKEIAKDIKIIKNKIDKLQDTVNAIGNDVRRLRGKNYLELLQLRMEKILEEKHLRDLDSVYVEIKTKEIDPETGQNITTQNGLVISSLLLEDFDNFNGEINEFLWDQKEINKDIFLLKGQAGSGKSRAAKMVEEFVWEQSLIPKQNKIKWIPIFISLPQLKDPKYNLFSEGLQQENYQFDQFQIKDLLEAIQKDEIKILLILDSYDEMNSQYIESNLYQTNKFKEEFSIEVSGSKLKIIITVRTEILKQQTYQTLFYGTSLKNLKEVDLLPFTFEQSQNYLKQFCTLNVKRQIKKLYDFSRQARGLKFDLSEFLQIVKPIEGILKIKSAFQQDIISEINPEKSEDDKKAQQKQNSEAYQNLSFQEQISSHMQMSQLQNFFSNTQNQVKMLIKSPFSQNQEMLSEYQIEAILKSLKKFSIFDKMNESTFLVLQKDLANIWSEDKFTQTISNTKINHLLQTPFMMEIVVQVLPLIVVIFSERENVLKQFCESFKYLKKKAEICKGLKYKYHSQLNKQVVRFENLDKKIDKNLVEVLEILERAKFFQDYSLSDQISAIDMNLIIKKKYIQMNDLETIDIVVKSLKMKKITIFDFYETFAKYYSESQLQKWRNLGKVSNLEGLLIDFSEYQESLALDMTIRQLTQVAYRNKGKLKLNKAQAIKQQQDSWEDQYFDNFGDLNYQKILQSCILLTSNGSTYSFTHKSIQEFYVGKYILDILRKSEANEISELIENSLFNQNQFNLSQIQYQGSINLIFDKLNQISNLQKKLTFIINLSKNLAFQRASSNCLFLCKSQKIYLINENFEKINIADITIEGLQMHNCNLSASILNNVAIDACNFNYCNLQKVDWKNIIYNESKTLKGHNCSIELLAFSQNNYLASYSNGGKILIWNYDEAKLIKQFDSKIEEIIYMTFSNNGKYLVVNDSKKIILWNTEIITSPIQVGQIEVLLDRVFFTNDDKMLISFHGKQILAWEVEKIIESYNPIVVINVTEIVSAQSYSKDGKYLIVGLQNGNLNAYNCSENYLLIAKLQKHKQQVNAVFFSDKETVFITGSKDQTLIIWEINQQDQISITHSLSYLSAEFKNILYNINFPYLLLLCNDNYIHKLNLDSENLNHMEIGLEEQTFDFSSEKIFTNREGRYLAFQNTQENVVICQIKNGSIQSEQLGTIQIITTKLKHMVFSNTKFIAFIFKSKIEIWNFFEFQETYQLNIENTANQYTQLAFSQDDNQILVSQSNGLVQVWLLSDVLKILYETKIKVEENGSDEYQNEDKQQLQINILQYSHNNLFFLIGRKDGLLKLVEKETYKEIIVINLKSITLDAQFYFDDSYLVVSSESEINILNFNYDEQTYKQSFLYASGFKLIGFVQILIDDILIAIYQNQVVFWKKLEGQLKQNKIYQIISIWTIDIKAYAILYQQNAIICKKNQSNYYQLYQLNKLINNKQQFQLIEGHENPITDLDYQNHDQYFVSIDMKKSIIWNKKSLEIVKILDLGGASVQLSQKNLIILYNLDHGMIIVDWQLNENNYRVIQKIILLFPVYTSQIWLKEGIIILSLIYDEYCSEIYVWKTTDYQTFSQEFFTQNQNVFKKQIQVNSKNLVLSFYDKNQKKLVFLSIQTNGFKQIIYQCMNQLDYMADCLFTNEGNIFFASQISNIKLYSANENQIISEYQFEKQIYKIQYLNKQRQLIVQLKDSIHVLNYGEVIKNFNKSPSPNLFHIFQYQNTINQIIVNEHTQILISFSDSNVLIWDIQTKQAVTSIPAHPQNINTIALTLNGDIFATGCQDHNIKIWNLQFCQKLQLEDSHQNSIDQLLFTDEGFNLISHCTDNTLTFWDVDKKVQIKCFMDIKKFCIHQNILIKYTIDSQLLYSYSTLDQIYGYLELFQAIDWIDQGIEEFQLLNNGLLQINNSYLLQITDFQQKKFSFVAQISGKQKVVLNQQGSQSFIAFDSCIITINVPPTLDYFACSQQHITTQQTILDIIYQENKIIIRYKENNEVDIYLNISEYFKENMKISLYKHECPIIQMKVHQNNLILLDDNGYIVFCNLQKNQFQVGFNLQQNIQKYQKCNCVEFSCSGRLLATGHEQGMLIIWNIEDQMSIMKLKELNVPKQQRVEQIIFLPSENNVACLSAEFIWFFQFHGKDENKILRSTFKCQKQFAFSKNYGQIFCIKNGQLKAFYSFDCFDFSELNIYEEIGARKFTKSNNILVYSNEEKEIKLFDMKNRKQLLSLEYDSAPIQILISESERIIVSLNTKNQIELWELASFDRIKSRDLPINVNKGITCMEITPNNQLLVFATKNLELYFLMIETNEILLQLRNFNFNISSICFAPNLQTFALGFSDGTIKLYSFNHKNLDLISQLEDQDFQLDFSKEPVCFKIFGKTPELMAFGCLIDESTILNQRNQSLIEVFKLKQKGYKNDL